MSEVKYEKRGSMVALSGDVEKLTLSLDIDKLLDLQNESTKLQCECMHLMEFAVTCKNGIADAAYAIRGDSHLDVVADVILTMATRIKELEQQLEQVRNDREIENGGV